MLQLLAHVKFDPGLLYLYMQTKKNLKTRRIKSNERHHNNRLLLNIKLNIHLQLSNQRCTLYDDY